MSALLLVDGTNVVMRCGFGGALPPDGAARTAAGMVARVVRETGAGFLIVAFDTPGATWHAALCPAYQAHRTTDTAPYVAAARELFTRRGWRCVSASGFQADDVIATIAGRLADGEVRILSSDSDLLALVNDRVRAIHVRAGRLVEVGPDDVVARYGVRPEQLVDYKALAGDAGDNIKGVPGIGPTKAARLLAQHQTLNAILVAGGIDYDRDTARVRQHRDAALLAQQLATLRRDVPLDPILPAVCWVGGEVAV